MHDDYDDDHIFLIHSEPSMKVREIKGLASSSVSSLDQDTLPAKLAPAPVHLYCP